MIRLQLNRRKQREFDAKRERIAELEARLRQYRAVLGIDDRSDSDHSKEHAVVDAVERDEIQDASTSHLWDAHTTGQENEEPSMVSSNDKGDQKTVGTSVDENESRPEEDREAPGQSTDPSSQLGWLRHWFF